MYNTDEFFIFEIMKGDDKTYLICCRKCYMKTQYYIIKSENATVTKYIFNDIFSVNRNNIGVIEVFLSHKNNINVSEDDVSILQVRFKKLSSEKL